MNPESYAKWVCPEYLHEIAAQYSNRLMNIESLGADINANLCAFVISELGHSINIWVNSSKTDKKKKKKFLCLFFFFLINVGQILKETLCGRNSSADEKNQKQ